jgi:phosphomannomutase
VLPILALLAMAREQGTPLSRLPAELPPRFTASDRLQDFPVEASRQLIERLAASGETLAGFLAPLALRPAGIDRTDGLRITLDGGEIVHLRPSGNAPELRCYAEAATQARAGSLSGACLARAREWAG